MTPPQTFEDSVAAVFEARGGPHSMPPSASSIPATLPASFQEGPGMTPPPPSVPPLNLAGMPFSGHRLDTTICEDDDDAEDPYTTRSHYMPPGAQDNLPEATPEVVHMPDTQTSHAGSGESE